MRPYIGRGVAVEGLSRRREERPVLLSRSCPWTRDRKRFSEEERKLGGTREQWKWFLKFGCTVSRGANTRAAAAFASDSLSSSKYFIFLKFQRPDRILRERSNVFSTRFRFLLGRNDRHGRRSVTVPKILYVPIRIRDSFSSRAFPSNNLYIYTYVRTYICICICV